MQPILTIIMTILLFVSFEIVLLVTKSHATRDVDLKIGKISGCVGHSAICSDHNIEKSHNDWKMEEAGRKWARDRFEPEDSLLHR